MGVHPESDESGENNDSNENKTCDSECDLNQNQYECGDNNDNEADTHMRVCTHTNAHNVIRIQREREREQNVDESDLICHHLCELCARQSYDHTGVDNKIETERPVTSGTEVVCIARACT